ncbi:hypothetical protein H632_c1764p0 [Helicosporidium sp. ATCC 50920]|nr:hypothetical protein H632_c1764p0 [Helicosporidium sp. ATCC 50920]|eukprot:KDD73877.1 hypothetical protein H632_c1764p0 [Helicosporidium sp. ATCC 50920]
MRNKLMSCGYCTIADIQEVSAVQLAQDAQISHEEALLVIKVAQRRGGSVQPTEPAVSARLLFEAERAQVRIITFSSELDRLLGGGIARGQVTEFCGAPGLGKTQIGMQLAIDVQIPAVFGGLEGEAVYIEGSFMLRRIAQMADAALLHLERVAEAKNDASRRAASASLSRDALLDGIHFFRVRDACEQSHPKVRLVVLDSVSFHLRALESSDAPSAPSTAAPTPGTVAPAPPRSRQLAQLASALSSLATRHHVAVVLTNQLTTRLTSATETPLGGPSLPAPDAGARLVPALGEGWLHACTSRVRLEWREGARVARLEKSPSLPGGCAAFDVTAEGVRGVRSDKKRGRGE